MNSFEGYDFIDFGASKGGSLRWASGTFGGKGIGVDIAPAKIEQLRAAGFDGFVADATQLDIPPGTFRYATMLDFLEHLPNAELAFAMIRQAVRVSRDFVFIRGPNFDELDYLKSLGFKKYYADWHGHKWHHTVADFQTCLAPLGVRFAIVETDRIVDSAHPALLPLSARRDRGPYDPATDEPKPLVRMRRPIYASVTVVISKSRHVDELDLFARSQALRAHIG